MFLITSFQFASGKAKTKIFCGKVIYTTDDYIEIKRGKTEILFYFTEYTKYIKKDKTEGGKELIEICQKVEAHYIKKNKMNILDKILILKESYCYR